MDEADNKSLNGFLTLPQEELSISIREHWVVLLLPITSTLFMGVFFISIGYLFLGVVLQSPLLLASLMLLTLILVSIAMLKILIDWYFHFYLLTNRKILEISYLPPFSKLVNSILLEQVRCTEIDVKTDGVINGILDMGDISITFDRPTHQEEFVIKNVKNPQKVGAFLSYHMGLMNTAFSNPAWSRKKNESNKFMFREELYKLSLAN